MQRRKAKHGSKESEKKTKGHQKCVHTDKLAHEDRRTNTQARILLVCEQPRGGEPTSRTVGKTKARRRFTQPSKRPCKRTDEKSAARRHDYKKKKHTHTEKKKSNRATRGAGENQRRVSGWTRERATQRGLGLEGQRGKSGKRAVRLWMGRGRGREEVSLLRKERATALLVVGQGCCAGRKRIKPG